MSTYKNIVNKLFVLALSMGGACVLLGCNTDNSTGQNSNNNEQMTEDDQADTSSVLASDSSEGELKKSLAVDSYRCIGCGKCVRVAPNNFEMENRKAVVVSDEVTSQTTQAINICPTKAITA